MTLHREPPDQILTATVRRLANQTRQPTPVERLACIRVPLARRGCALRLPKKHSNAPITMKSRITCLLATLVGGFVLAGCCTSHHSKTWEYKVVELGIAGGPFRAEESGALLNDQAKQGWTFIQTDRDKFYFKRASK